MDLFSSQKIIHGDCLKVMNGMESNIIDCILTDPPYGLSFMGQHWDKGIPGKDFWDEALRVCKPGATMLAFGGTRTYHRLTCSIEDAGWEIRDCLMWIYGTGFPKSHNKFGFEGYGTALKPAYEPIIMAMKPLDGTFAHNAEKWDVAGINIDACRISVNDNNTNGRWPSNILFDEISSHLLDKQSGITKSPSGNIKGTRSSGGILNRCDGQRFSNSGHGDSGGASRFFYCSKASCSERGYFNKHPTVKPIKLLEYLLKLIMPKNPKAIVLDPFLGSGSTLVAAKKLGFNAVGIEINHEYCEIAKCRVGI